MLKLISFCYVNVLKLIGIRIGSNVRVWPMTFFSTGFANGKKGTITLAADCELSQGTVLKAYGGHIGIGKNTFLGEYCVLYGHGGIDIGENTLIAMHTCIISANHTLSDQNTLIRSQPDVLLPVKIGNDVWIGAGVKILGGVIVGNGCVIGAGSVVTKDVPDFAIAVGVPCKVTGYRNE